jgi:uracil-DNA glycosylase family 4
VNDLQHCQLCSRLSAYRKLQKTKYPAYHCLPVAAFGEPKARLLIVGLAPGLHGANATGRPFTGDASGDMLFHTLHKFGLASQPLSHTGKDNMQLFDCRITNAVKCLPPQNRPNGSEISNCNAYLREEISLLRPGSVVIALGTTAHRSVLKALNLGQSQHRFGHLAEHELPGELKLIDSYHCSRYNINTRRLNQVMFDRVFQLARRRLE